jgi:hypothetical protein
MTYVSTAPKVKPAKAGWKSGPVPARRNAVKGETAHEKAPTENDAFATPAEFDFSDYMVPGAVLPAAELEYSDLQHQFGRMLVGAFEQQGKGAGRDTALEAWDEYIFDSIQEYGPLVLLSRSVVRRIHAWQFDVSCIPKLERLGKELTKAAKVRHRLAPGAITPKHVSFKEFIVRELSLLRTKLVDDWPRDKREILEFIGIELLQPDCPYPNLARNARTLLSFLQQSPDAAVRFRGTFKPGSGRIKGGSDDVGPARLAHLWMAYSENRTEDSVRQGLWQQAKHLKPLGK